MNKVFVSLLIVFAFFLSSLPCLSELNILFDEDAKNEAGEGNFVGKFVSHDAGSTVTVTSKDAFSGKASVFVTPAQSYNNQMANWSFRITDKPSAKNEYRYIRFA